MTEAPPIVFIARHGARLDAADKNWHLTSPTPYDPPLSYGGWLQARALGLRIASLLEAPQYAGKEPESLLGHPAASSNPTTATSSSIKPGPPLRYNFIIHTSPYLRCLQTAIGVSAGLSHHRSAEHTSESSPLSGATQDLVTENGAQDKRPLLRVDAFLGEWLSPDYFEQIIPPPPSEKMVVSAKTELLRRGEGIPNPRNSRSTSGHFPGGWGSDSASKTTEKDHERQVFPGNAAGSSSLGELSQRPRSSTFNTPTDPAIPRGRALGRLNTDIRPSILSAYKPPTPSYAVSPSDPIPVGYVAHARDACTRIDYQWDSMRTPYWGTGGEYGEEWGLMHERVHAGFQKMIDYYRDGESPSDRGRALSNGSSPVEGPTQTVLIIITHGADCNALIGALAGRSVLLDIGTASLTMAVRRDRLGVASSPSSDRVPESLRAPNLPSSLTDRGARLVSQEYSLQLIASNDHLRAGVNPSQLASLTSPTAPQPLPPPSISSYRNRTASRPSASILQGSFVIDSTPKINTNMRNWSQNRRSSPTSAPPRGGPGLWGSIRSPTIEADEDADENYVPNFGNPTLARPENHEKSDTDPDQTNGPGGLKQLPRRTASQRGLWGSAQTLDDRNATSRRRWTVTDQKL